MIKKTKNTKAATMVEFAIAIPVMLFFILVLIDFCVFYFVKNSLDHVARKAVASASIEPGLDHWDSATNQRSNAGSIQNLLSKFKDPTTNQPILPALLVSTGLVHNYDIQFIEPENSATLINAYKENPFHIRATAEYRSLVGFLPFMPKQITSEAYGYREYQENSSLAVPVDCLGNVYSPTNPAVVNPSLCPCVGSSDPLARQANPNDPTVCECPNGLPLNADGTCGCPENSAFISSLGQCVCIGNRQFSDNTLQQCICKPCNGSINTDTCSCSECNIICPPNTRKDLQTCSCECTDPNKTLNGGVCACNQSLKDACILGAGNSDNYFNPNNCSCNDCSSSVAIDDFTIPTSNGLGCECKIEGPGGLREFCSLTNQQIDTANGRCRCLPICTDGQLLSSGCQCNITSTTCQERNLGNLDPLKCQCSGRCIFGEEAENAAGIPPTELDCDCPRDQLAIECGGADKVHPVYCKCIGGGPCNDEAMIQWCKEKFSLPYDRAHCACAEGICTGDTILENGKCVCDPRKVATLQAQCPNTPVIQVTLPDGSTKCDCGVTCTDFEVLLGDSCACMGVAGCTTAGCVETRDPGKFVDLVAQCAVNNLTVDRNSCGCGAGCPEPKRIVNGNCICTDQAQLKASCIASNGTFNETTCECNFNCPNGYNTYDVNGNAICHQCPNNKVFLPCAGFTPSNCTDTACCAEPVCQSGFDCECINGSWFVLNNE